MSDTPESPDRAAKTGSPGPAVRPVGPQGISPPGSTAPHVPGEAGGGVPGGAFPGTGAWPAGASIPQAQELVPPSPPITPLARIGHTHPEVALHPLLPGGVGGERLFGPVDGQSAHNQPHAASAGPTDGSRGALWFVLGIAAVVILALLVAAVIAATN